ncbi:aminodeoxychorismate synthase component I [Tomitella biformata]|uniref:aminodeoxychorismate synthase component I n=1 Tax=Tomitella biformata TaxID=630403 RepID=UPI0004633044|nr:aminodeoxychorismate synthase component I [Tomitella biformata]
MRIEQLGPGLPAADVLRNLARRAAADGLAPPAALIGDWFDSAAVLAPSVDVLEVPPADAFSAVSSPASGAPIVGGGWIGYLAYPDLSNVDESPRRIPQAAGGWTDHVLRLDSHGCWWFESLLDEPCPAALLNALTATPPASSWSIDWQAPSRADHRAAVLDCLDNIAAGEIYQACVCTAYAGRAAGSAIDFFADAVSQTSPSQAALIAGDWGAVASMSPELFLRRRGAQVWSSPIKGTSPIDSDPALLRASIKDVAENVMIVDLARNDLGRVAVPGSVTATELLAIRPAPAVWHLVSTVTARLRPEIDDAALIDATFPPASVTGTPKHRARQLLAGWESSSRGIYCGAVGMVSPLAGLQLNVAIRTVEFDSLGGAVLGIGGGITSDSDPDAEWQECLDKASSIVGLQRPDSRG